MEKLSQVADRTSGTPACPNCGSVSFSAKRSKKGLVLGGVLAPKSVLRCDVCGTKFRRG